MVNAQPRRRHAECGGEIALACCVKPTRYQLPAGRSDWDRLAGADGSHAGIVALARAAVKAGRATLCVGDVAPAQYGLPEMSDDAKAQPDLTIGELFAEGDLLGEWVFSLSAVADDLREIERRTQALHGNDLRTALLFQRLLAVRLYEARRLVYIVDVEQVIRESLGEQPPVWFNTLREMYQPCGKSRVDELYAVTRHQGVHYVWPGSGELQRALRAVRHLPARLKIITDETGRDVSAEWAQMVAGLSVFGELGEEGWKSRSKLTATLVTAWLRLNAFVVVVYAQLGGFLSTDSLSASRTARSSGRATTQIAPRRRLRGAAHATHALLSTVISTRRRALCANKCAPQRSNTRGAGSAREATLHNRS